MILELYKSWKWSQFHCRCSFVSRKSHKIKFLSNTLYTKHKRYNSNKRMRTHSHLILLLFIFIDKSSCEHVAILWVKYLTFSAVPNTVVFIVTSSLTPSDTTSSFYNHIEEIFYTWAVAPPQVPSLRMTSRPFESIRDEMCQIKTSNTGEFSCSLMTPILDSRLIWKCVYNFHWSRSCYIFTKMKVCKRWFCLRKCRKTVWDSITPTGRLTINEFVRFVRQSNIPIGKS